MLSEIYVNNYILVPELRLKFQKGLTVISGETGAGKSIIVGSIALIFGESAAGLEAFDNTRSIYLEATFIPSSVPELEALLSDLPNDNNEELILAREVSPAGKSTYFIGGRKVSVGVLRSLKPLLLDFHHQRDQQKLLSNSYQLEILDIFSGTYQQREQFGFQYRSLRKMHLQLKEMKELALAQKQLLELYRFQYEELEKAEVQDDEDVFLQQELELLNHSQEILELVHGMNQSLFETENSLFDQLSYYCKRLESFRSLNPTLDNSAKSLLEAQEFLRDASFSLAQAGDSIQCNPERIEYIEARLDLINSLLHKHRVHNLQELRSLFEQRSQQLLAAGDAEQQIHALEGEIASASSELIKLADILSEKRIEGSKSLSAKLLTSIQNLAIEDGDIQIKIDKKDKPENIQSDVTEFYRESGQDSVEILFKANKGGSLKPLAQVVSGGELSRILLGIKQVLVSGIAPKLLILDEIDSGIGGKTAEKVAACIANIALQHPVLCITHLAQIAAVADTHIAVEKTGTTKTRTDLRILNSEERTIELARMLSGSVTSAALKHAEELKKN